jgi:hypothetical protein
LIETFEVFHERAKLRERGGMEEGGMEGLSKIEEAKM